MPGRSSVPVSKRVSADSKKETVDTGVKKILIWPEWTEAEIAADKWETGGKAKDKGKNIAPTGIFFEDPEGQPKLPLSLSSALAGWKRPHEYLTEQETPVVVADKDDVGHIDLLSANQHLLRSKLMCSIIVQLQILNYLRGSLPPLIEAEQPSCPWQPWHHLQWPKGSPCSTHNPQGKYCVKLYWMGCWRKITVDDQLPIDNDGNLLLPATTNRGELWPMIITKAILKIINLECINGVPEVKDFDMIELITGWICETVDIKNETETWSIISSKIPKWIRPLDSEEDGHDDKVEETRKPVPATRDAIVLGYFNPTPETIEFLTEYGVSFFDPIHPILLTQWRDEPLVLPPKERPLPTLEAPYYLGLTSRRHRPGTETPPPPKTDFRSSELFSPFISSDNPLLSWIELFEIMTVFQQLTIYHKPGSFANIQSFSQLTMTKPNSSIPPPTTGTKKGAIAASMSQLSQPKSTVYNNILFIDSCYPSSVLINFSSISSWYERDILTGTIVLSSLGLTKLSDETSDKEKGERKKVALITGSLTAKLYSWKQYSGINKALFTIRTAGSKSRFLHLPEGRHVIKFHMTAPFGYHLALYSQTPFSLTDEDGVLPLLSEPSERLRHHSQMIFELLLTLAEQISDTDLFKEKLQYLLQIHDPRGVSKSHINAIRVATLHAIHTMGPQCGLDTGHMFAWKSFINKFTVDLKSMFPDDKEEAPSMKFAEMKKLKFGPEGKEMTEEDVEYWKNIASCDVIDLPEPTNNDDNKVSKCIEEKKQRPSMLSRTKAFQGSDEVIEDTEKKDSSQITKTEESTSVSAEITEEGEREGVVISCVSLLKPHASSIGAAIFKSLFTLRPDILCMFSFGTDEHSRAYYIKFSPGQVPHLGQNKWTILFRDVFHISNSQEVCFQFHCPIKTCLLKLVNNDTGIELSCSPSSSSLYTVEPNMSGYTILGEVWSLKEVIEGGDKWSFTLISSYPNLPSFNSSSSSSSPTAPTSLSTENKLTTEYHLFEKRDYYLPDRDLIMLQYVVKVTTDCLVTIQLDTSKTDAFFKLEILDMGEVIASKDGHGHCVISALIFSPSTAAVEDDPNSTSTEHHYVIKAVILDNSWSLEDSAWPYISMIRSMEKEARSEKPLSSKKGKGRDKGAKTPKTSQSVPPVITDSLDTTKPYWTLRVFTNLEHKDYIKVVKDTQKEDNIKSMVQVWDTIEPGRSIKAQQLRHGFLETRAIFKEESAPDEETASVGTAVSASTTTTLGTNPLCTPISLKPHDLSPFIIKSDDTWQLLDETLERQCDERKRSVIRRYRNLKNNVFNKRDRGYQKTDCLKNYQFTIIKSRQIVQSSTRSRLDKPREAIIESYLAAERAKQEALLAAEREKEEAAQAAAELKKIKTPKGKKK